MAKALLTILLLAAARTGHTAPEQSILFIGSSALGRHDVPGLVEALATAANGGKWSHQSVLKSATTLGALYGDGKTSPAVRALQSGRWTHVVLQERNVELLERYEDALRSARAFADLARERGATPVYLGKYPFRSAPSSAAELASRCHRIAEAIGARYVPVPEAWTRSPTKPLYDDEEHPSLAGAYVIAGLIQQVVAGERGWRMLFDGKSTKGWRGMLGKPFPEDSWTVANGCLQHGRGQGRESKEGGDILTEDQFSSFELELEWKLEAGGNSGIKYLVADVPPPIGTSLVGFEYQVLDDARHPDAKKGRDGNRTVGSLYDTIPAATDKPARPMGEFNQTRIIVRGGHVEHWLNGKLVVSFDRFSGQFDKLVTQSKYKDIANFGKWARGHILLQDHGNEVCYRNIRIRDL